MATHEHSAALLRSPERTRPTGAARLIPSGACGERSLVPREASGRRGRSLCLWFCQ
jgi:hypothetical protein